MVNSQDAPHARGSCADFPPGGAIVFQDAFLGVWPITTALIRLGVTPLATLNFLIIASFALSAFAAYLLCAKVSNDRWAAFAGGIVYGFAIFRVAHQGHLHVLLTFWLPLVLLCLHTYLASRRWVVVVRVNVLGNAGTDERVIFLVYGTLLIGLWALFFFAAGWSSTQLFGPLVPTHRHVADPGLYRRFTRPRVSTWNLRSRALQRGYCEYLHAPPMLAVGDHCLAKMTTSTSCSGTHPRRCDCGRCRGVELLGQPPIVARHFGVCRSAGMSPWRQFSRRNRISCWAGSGSASRRSPRARPYSALSQHLIAGFYVFAARL